MSVLGLIATIVVFIFLLFVALGFNLLESERPEDERRRRAEMGAYPWPMTTAGLGLLWLVPWLVMVYMANDMVRDRLLSVTLIVSWTFTVGASFVLARHLIFRPMLRWLDARRTG